MTPGNPQPSNLATQGVVGPLYATNVGSKPVVGNPYKKEDPKNHVGMAMDYGLWFIYNPQEFFREQQLNTMGTRTWPGYVYQLCLDYK